MKDINEKEAPTGALLGWLNNIEGRSILKIKASGQTRDCLRILHELGGTTIAEGLRHSPYHMREIQKCLILGFIEQVPKDCDICSGRRNGGRAACMGQPRRCAARHLYSITMCGLKVLHKLKEVPYNVKRFYYVDININPYWFEYFKKHIW